MTSPSRSWVGFAVVIGLVNLPIVHYFVFRRPPTPTATVPFTDAFNDASSLNNYRSTGGHWRVAQGELVAPGARNNPLWLAASLPANAAVEFDVRGQSPDGDLKVEIFGNGLDHASGYVLIHGGWNNRLSVIARLDEHGEPLSKFKGPFQAHSRVRVEASPYPVQLGKTYHWRIERSGKSLKWLIDGQPFMQFEDPMPLAGSGHDRFGFSGWDAEAVFDNLKIEPL